MKISSDDLAAFQWQALTCEQRLERIEAAIQTAMITPCCRHCGVLLNAGEHCHCRNDE